MKIEFWPHRGTFKESQKARKQFLSLQEALEYVIEDSKSLTGEPLFSLKDIYIQYYGFDSRLQNECFMLCIGKYGPEDYIKKYKHPMCRGYLYFEEFKIKEDDLQLTDSLFKLSFNEHKKIIPQQFKRFLIEKCDVAEENIEIFHEYCHFIRKEEFNIEF